MKLCVDCKHMDERPGETSWTGVRHMEAVCRAVEGWPSAVLGGPMEAPLVSYVRMSELCGWHEPKLWEPKEPAANAQP